MTEIQARPGESSLCFEELARRFEPLLHRAWRRALPGIEYEDYAQDVFLNLFRSIDRLRNPKAFPGYFRRIALTVASNHVRKFLSQESADLRRVEQVVDDLDASLFNGIFIRSYLEHLPGKERQVLNLTYLEDCSVTEIGQMMALSASAVRSLKMRAIMRLREKLRRDANVLAWQTEKSEK